MEQNPDATLGVEFFVDAVEHPRKTKEAGRPIYVDREMVRIRFPGDNKKEVVAPAHEMHYNSAARQQMTYAERFRGSYEQFKEHGRVIGSGTPLTEAPFLTAAQRKEAGSQNIHTVEQLAGIDDRVLAKLGVGWRDLKAQAEAFLTAADSTSEVAALRKQIEELQAQLVQEPQVATPQPPGSEFDDFERDDLFNMAVDAGLSPRQNASRESLVTMLTEAAQKASEAA